MKQNNNHGGARQGAGRKPNDRNVPLMVRVSPEAAQVLEGVRNKSEYIDGIIVAESKSGGVKRNGVRRIVVPATQQRARIGMDLDWGSTPDPSIGDFHPAWIDDGAEGPIETIDAGFGDMKFLNI